MLKHNPFEDNEIIILANYMEVIDVVEGSEGKEISVIRTNNHHIAPWDFEIPMNYIPTNRISISNTEMSTASSLVTAFNIGQSLKISSDSNEEVSFDVTGRVIVNGEVHEDGYSLVALAKEGEHVLLEATVVDKTIIEVRVTRNGQSPEESLTIELIPDILLAGIANYHQAKLLSEIATIVSKRCRFNNKLFKSKIEQLEEKIQKYSFFDGKNGSYFEFEFKKLKEVYIAMTENNDIQLLPQVGKLLDNLVLKVIKSITDAPDRTKKAVKKLEKSSIF